MSRVGEGDGPEPEWLDDVPVRMPRRREAEREQLDGAPPPRRRLSARWLLVVTVAVALGVGGVVAWHADQRASARESEALTACRVRVHLATVSSDLLLAVVASNLRPTLRTTHGRHRRAVLAVMANPARRLVPGVSAADRACRDVSVLPWHFSHRAGRDAVTAYSSALAAKVRAIAGDGATYFRDDPSLRRLRRAADIGVLGGRY